MRAWQVILILVCLVASFTAGYHIRGDVASDSISKTDTSAKVDTIHDSIPTRSMRHWYKQYLSLFLSTLH